MANRRMFSIQIVASDAFLEMPPTTRELYFQLGMYADDDGFVSPRKVMRMINAAEDDLKVLITKRFVLPFENGVVVVKHWKINNEIKKDRYKPSQYTELKNRLFIKENGAYTDVDPKCIQSGDNLEAQDRIGKVRIGKDSKDTLRAKAPTKLEAKDNPNPDVKKFIDFFHKATQTIRRVDAIIDGAKDGNLTKLRMKTVDLPRMEAMTIWYLSQKRKVQYGETWHEEYKNPPSIGAMLSTAFFSQLLSDEKNAINYVKENMHWVQKLYNTDERLTALKEKLLEKMKV